MEYSLKEKVVLVTGGANGIGAITLEYFLDEKVQHVAFIDILEEKGKEQQNKLRRKYGDDKITFYKCDITEEDQLFDIFKSVFDKYGTIDVLVNNAGIFNDSVPRKEIDINVAGVITSTLKGIQLMHKDKGGKGGVIINISSVAAFIEDYLFPVYICTKSAVLRFSNSIGMPEYYSATGVRVIAICFGATGTSMLSNYRNFDQALNTLAEDCIRSNDTQKVESAARSIIDVCKIGETGTTWLSIADKPPINITADVKQAYKALWDKVLSHLK